MGMSEESEEIMIVEDLMQEQEPEEEPNRLYSVTPASTSKPDTHKVAGALFDITDQAARLAELLPDSDEEITPEAEELLAEIMQEGPKQIEATVVIIREYEARQAANAFEAKRYSDRAAKAATTVTFLKDVLAVALDTAFGGKVKTETVTVYNQDSNTESVDLREGASLDELLQVNPGIVRVVLSLDKQKAKEQANETDLSSFIEIKHNHSRSVRIR